MAGNSGLSYLITTLKKEGKKNFWHLPDLYIHISTEQLSKRRKNNNLPLKCFQFRLQFILRPGEEYQKVIDINLHFTMQQLAQAAGLACCAPPTVLIYLLHHKYTSISNKQYNSFSVLGTRISKMLIHAFIGTCIFVKNSTSIITQLCYISQKFIAF